MLSRDSGAVLLRPFAAADLAERPLTEKVLWRNYLIIVGVFLAVFAFRAGFDIAHYGTEKSQVKEAVAIQYADYDKNPSTPTEELNPSWHMYSRGYTLPDVFAETRTGLP